MKSRLRFLKNLNALRRPQASVETTIVIYDRALFKHVPGFQSWVKKYPHAFPVAAGESLKSLESFSKIASAIHRAVGDKATRQWTVLAMGGGSVGDFAGFFASVYKRGLMLVHVPTTWLAALDSSHGGKTALNLRGAKNQIGTFYPASETILIQNVLEALPNSNLDDAMGELAKIALIDGRAWARKLRRPVSRGARAKVERAQAVWLWRQLPSAIESKLRIVARDPEETRGDRRLLNLGHSFGHVLEAFLGLSHGASVGYGLLFAIDLSESLGELSSFRASEIRTWLGDFGISGKPGKRIPSSKARALLLRDKKRESGNGVEFLLLKKPGHVVRRKLDVDLVLKIAQEAGWTR